MTFAPGTGRGIDLASELEIILKQRGTREKILQVFREVREHISFYSVPDPHGRIAYRRWNARVRLGELRIEEEIVEQLPGPPVCTAEDIRETMLEHLALPEEEVTEVHYDQFMQAMVAKVFSIRTSKPFLIASATNIESYELPCKLWEGDSGIRLYMVKSVQAGYDPETAIKTTGWKHSLGDPEPPPPEPKVGDIDLADSTLDMRLGGIQDMAVMWGRCTKRAMIRCIEETRRIIQTVVRSLEETGDLSPLLNTIASPLPDPDTPSCITFLRDMEHFLQLYYAPSPNKTTKKLLDTRLRIAVHLLVEADRQSHDTVNLSLAFSAIEALAGENETGILDELSRNIATLLQPDARERRNTFDGIKSLYKARCKLLHGERLESKYGDDRSVRKLAAGIMRAVMEWQAQTEKKTGKPASIADYFEELDDAKTSGGMMAGIPKESSTWLPTPGAVN